MRPLSLTLEGVYSYRKKQTIDFATLSEAGIFGIFGAVGSGKSAILESMTYALYGQIERLNDKEQRGYNIMNLQSDALYIDFQFSHGNEDYRFTVSAKRNKKDFHKIMTPQRTAARRKGEEWVPLPDEKVRGGVTAESVLGLSYEHFRKTVIIPQGKFQEFIMLPPSQRTGMIESLFGLERFNLSTATNILLARSKEQVSFLKGRLDELKDADEETLKSLELSRKEIDRTISELERKLESSGRLLRLLEIRQEKEKQLEETKYRLNSALERKDEYDSREKALAEYDRFHRLFAADLTALEEIRTGIEKNRKKKDSLGLEGEQLEKALEQGAERWRRLSEDYERYPELNREMESLQAFAERESLREKSKNLKTVLQRTAEESATTAEEIHNIKERIEQSENRIKQHELKQEEDVALRAAEDRLRRYKEGETALAEINSAIESSKASEKEQRQNLAGRMPETGDIVDFETVKEKVLEILTRRNKEREAELKRRSHRQIMEEIAADLKEGEPCPLCGSPHHPGLEDHGIETASPVLGDGRSKEEEEIRDRLTGLEILIRERQNLEKDKSSCEERLRLITEESGDSFNREQNETELKRKRDALEQSARELRENRREVSSLRQTLDILNRRQREGDERKIRTEKDFESVEARINEMNGKILADHQIAPDMDKLAELRIRLEALTGEYPSLKKKREAQETSLRENESVIRSLELLLQKEKERRDALEAKIEASRIETGEPDLKRIKSVLTAPLNGEEERKAIESYRRSLALLEEQFKERERQLSEDDTPPGDRETLKQEIAENEGLRKDALNRRGSLEQEERSLQIRLNQKKELTLQLDGQSAREENLKELSSLFKGRKFVEYIAAVYLQELCSMANERFSPLTNRSLELVFRDNQIMVRDYLNEGRLRHIKTLSGGQSFQAALCLALALSEQTGRGEGSFFFLDEGFGSLDRTSLETVMDTLRKLSRDGRIIGLISHVEDMQQNLDVWLKISNSPEEGSRTVSSWSSGA